MAKKKIKKVKKTEYPKSVTKEAVKEAVKDGDLVKREVPHKSNQFDALLNLEQRIDKLQSLVTELNNQLCIIGDRIDRLVTAISKAKSVKGL